MSHSFLLFTDVDGCLVNKHDYNYAAALPALERLRTLQIPVVLCSSKTSAELRELAAELRLDAPLICENGARIHWRGAKFGSERSTTNGLPRVKALDALKRLKTAFRFRSFEDLGLEGVMDATDLPREQAVLAMDREGTEPLLWDDDDDRICDFESALRSDGLTLTRGGRFWHVGGGATKGNAMLAVTQEYQSAVRCPVETIAIGDSPIDQSMLDLANWPIGIPAPDGTRGVSVSDDGFFAATSGAAGWTESVNRLLDRLAVAF